MSEPRNDSEPCWPEDLESEGTVVSRYRFGARHAVALSLVAMLSIAVLSTMLARNQRAEEHGWLETGNLPTGEAREIGKVQWPEISPKAHDLNRNKPSTSSLKTFSEKDQADPFSRARGFIAELRRAIERETVTRAFAQLDLNDSRHVRTFLTAYGANAYARQQGYVEAVHRGVREAGLYASGEIVSCGKCWCWQSKPAHAGPPALTE